MLISAIFIPFFNENIYLGQNSPNIWHNPTTIFTIPLAFLAFSNFIKLIGTNEKDLFIKFGIRTSIFLVLSTLAKPNFSLVFIPGVVIFLLIKYQLNWKLYLKILIVFLPTLIVFLIQILIIFRLEGGVINLDFLGVWSSNSPNPLISLLILIAFPLFVIIFFKNSIKDNSTLLIWITLIVALVQSAFLAAESEEWFDDGNLSWGLAIVLPLFFTYSLVNLLRIIKDLHNYKTSDYYLVGICFILFTLHLASGIIYFIQIFTGNGFY